MASKGVYKQIQAIAACIPEGRVSTYGQLARLAGYPRGAQMAGWAMMALPEEHQIPAHRVVHADGTICTGSAWEALQRQLLLEEGVAFDDKGRVDMTCQMDDGELLLLTGNMVL